LAVGCAQQGEGHETACAYSHDNIRDLGLRDDAAATRDADLPGWIANSGQPAVSASAAASTAPTASSDGLPGWNHSACGNDLPDSATATANAEAVRRTRLSDRGALPSSAPQKILV